MYLHKKFLFFTCFLLFSCRSEQRFQTSTSIEEIAGNETVANYMRSFEGRGVQTDFSEPTSLEEALQKFTFPQDIEVKVLAAEPLITQPVELNFDHKGRLWVVQYSQYPFPAGVKVVDYDYHLRAQFDKVPQAPPLGVKGADKISVLEDTNGDGIFDKSTDAISGLNIATSLTWGRGKIWVLNPPYLLAYPDPDGDGFPDGKAVVHLQGFGLEDTHAVANSLRWGPDGWLYGAQGSTCIAHVRSSVTEPVHFKGQAIWRYHPETEVFELYAEGGGNTFHVEIDEKGRVYSGHNGAQSRGQYYKQGAYYVKNWGKHGALSNPYAFGFFPHMPLEGEKVRFTHAFIKYEGGSLPPRYTGKLIGINPLLNYVQVSRFEPYGSYFKNVDEEKILSSSDHWFRPVDIKAGPDGGIYLADWSDSRLSHIDPRDTWHKNSGRIYKISGKEMASPIQNQDLSKRSSDELIDLLSHKNKWLRQQALRQLGDRKDPQTVPRLQEILSKEKGQLALEALWALNLTGAFDETRALQGLQHQDPFVRMWTVRLLGDAKEISAAAQQGLTKLALQEMHPEVRSQIAASAKRLPGPESLDILQALLSQNSDAEDPHIPLQIWWALESKSISHQAEVLALFEEAKFWKNRVVTSTVLARLMQRYILQGGEENYAAATRLFALAPQVEYKNILTDGLLEGLRGKDMASLPPSLLEEIQRGQHMQNSKALELRLRQGEPSGAQQALQKIAEPSGSLSERLSYVRILGEIQQKEAIPALLDLVSDRGASPSLRQASIYALQRFENEEIGEKVLAFYPDLLRAEPDLKAAALAMFSSRVSWTRLLLSAIEDSRKIARTDVPQHLVQQMKLLGDEEIRRKSEQLWPEYQAPGSLDKSQKIAEIKALLKARTGNVERGKEVFQQQCGTCHKLYDTGGDIGPELTGYDRQDLDYMLLNTVDPNAAIREGYVNYLAQTQDGRTLTGIMHDQSGGTTVLRSIDGQLHHFTENQIQVLRALPVSIMPEGLMDPLTDQELQDLFAYLQEK